MQQDQPVIETKLPPIGIPLPEANFAEILLKHRLREGDFEKLQAVLEAMKWGLIEPDEAESEKQ